MGWLWRPCLLLCSHSEWRWVLIQSCSWCLPGPDLLSCKAVWPWCLQDIQDWLWREMEQPGFKWWAARAELQVCEEQHVPTNGLLPCAALSCSSARRGTGFGSMSCPTCPALSTPAHRPRPPPRSARHAGARTAARAGCCCPRRRLRCWTWQQRSTFIPHAGRRLSWQTGLPWTRMTHSRQAHLSNIPAVGAGWAGWRRGRAAFMAFCQGVWSSHAHPHLPAPLPLPCTHLPAGPAACQQRAPRPGAADAAGRAHGGGPFPVGAPAGPPAVQLRPGPAPCRIC